MVDPHRMMRKYDPAEGFTQPLVHAWFVGVNINAIRCTQHDACITLVGWCAQPLAYAWRAWVNATATRCRRAAYLCEEVCTREVWTGRGRVHALSTMGVDSAFCIPMPNAGAREGLSTVSTPYGYAPRGRDLLS